MSTNIDNPCHISTYKIKTALNKRRFYSSFRIKAKKTFVFSFSKQIQLALADID
ncbi:hypothetical protein [Pseudoalteromonas sp. B530]|uniref:hypothetical protein n=1 Tax=Pseudoalteromonas sp. B530 TaxID=2994390 RepID=UPI00224AE2A7|nr:hypothetical protein [Pseudoalteromonas sp. B530]MCX2767289.1 hypothetical protein [Pseudoalteromonas sp. B530]